MWRTGPVVDHFLSGVLLVSCASGQTAVVDSRGGLVPWQTALVTRGGLLVANSSSGLLVCAVDCGTGAKPILVVEPVVVGG